MGLVVVGSLALDSIETPKGKVDRALGGTAMHFANAASFVSTVYLVGVVGGDFPKQGFDLLSQKNVTIEGLTQIPSGKTFTWTGRYEQSMHVAVTLETNLNVFESFSPEIPQSYVHKEYLFLGNIHPSLQHEVYEKVQPTQATALDSMNFWIDSEPNELLKILKKVDIVLLNDHEVKELSGCDNLVRAAREVLRCGPRYVVVKQGEFGASLFGRENAYFALPAYPLEEIQDPTGAGDSFAGGFMSYLDSQSHCDWSHAQTALAYGIVVSSFCVQDFGVQALAQATTHDLHTRFEDYAQHLHCGKFNGAFLFGKTKQVSSCSNEDM